MNWLTIAVIIFLVLCLICGWVRGFVKMAAACLTTIVTIAVVIIGTPYVKDFLQEKTQVYTRIEQAVEGFVEENLDQNLSAADRTQQTSVIQELPLPKALQTILIENNSPEKYQELGTEQFSGYISGFLANVAFSILIYIAMFLIVWIILRILFSLLDGIAQLPLINMANTLAGAVFGFASGILFVWICCMIVTALSATAFGIRALQLIQESAFLSFLYNNNLLLQTITGALRSF